MRFRRSRGIVRKRVVSQLRSACSCAVRGGASFWACKLSRPLFGGGFSEGLAPFASMLGASFAHGLRRLREGLAQRARRLVSHACEGAASPFPLTAFNPRSTDRPLRFQEGLARPSEMRNRGAKQRDFVFPNTGNANKRITDMIRRTVPVFCRGGLSSRFSCCLGTGDIRLANTHLNWRFAFDSF